MNFEEFLHNVRWAFWIGLGTLVILIALNSLGYLLEFKQLESDAKFYMMFGEHSDSALAPTARRLMMDKELSTESRAVALKETLELKKGSDFVELLTKKPEIGLMLLTNPAGADELAHAQVQKIEELTWTPLAGWQWPYFLYQIVGLLALMVPWLLLGARSPTFFPLKKWWFYGYLLTLGWVALIFVVLLALIELGRVCVLGRQGWWERVTGNDGYSVLCRGINQKRATVRQKWTKTLSVPRLELVRRQKVNQLDEVRDELASLGERIESKQREYFSLRHYLSENKEHDDTVTLNRMPEEFDKLLANPNVRAVDIDNSYIYVYTGLFRHPVKLLVGPFLIKIDLDDGKRQILAADKSTNLHPECRRDGSFCFGNVASLIDDHLRERRIADAVGVIFKALESA